MIIRSICTVNTANLRYQRARVRYAHGVAYKVGCACYDTKLIGTQGAGVTGIMRSGSCGGVPSAACPGWVGEVGDSN